MQTKVPAEDSQARNLTPQPAVELARHILDLVFAGVEAPLIALQDGTVLHRASDSIDAMVELKHAGGLRLLLGGASDLSAGEAAMRGDIKVKGDIERAFAAMDAVAATRTPKDWLKIASLAAGLPHAPSGAPPSVRRPAKLRGRVHSLERDRAAIAYHYDVSNDFYALWLDSNMVYSCAYFKDTSDTIDEAQLQKCDLICRKLRLKRGERLLDIGCGWGGLVRFACREYGVEALGVTLSQRQADYAQTRIKDEGLHGRCQVKLLDYRELGTHGRFDKIASVGMVEHVGDAMLPLYFQAAFQALAPGGLFLNHGIISQRGRPQGRPAPASRFLPHRSRFTESYVFPDGEMPELARMCEAAAQAGFEVRDVENLREHYTLTLRCWRRRLEEHEREARSIVGDGTFNVWRFWLAGSAHNFAIGSLGVVQMVLAKDLPGAGTTLLRREELYR